MRDQKNQGITFEETVKVLLDGKHVGDIKTVKSPSPNYVCGYQYFPRNKKEGGEVFISLHLCKQSLF